jgi:tripartite-type tricarboxylate transporter receptor subunit TctC
MKSGSAITRRSLLALGAASAGSTLWPQFGQAKGLVKILVGFPPGQATDTVARLMAQRMQPVTGDNYIVDNRPGQGGSIAMGLLAKSPADGTVAMLTHMSAVATNPHLYKSVPYDSRKDFEAAGLVGDLPFVLVCNPSLPFTDIKGFVEYAKAHPKKLNHSSSGNGTVSHLAMEEFKRKVGIDVEHVPYKGSGPGLIDVVSGNVSVALETAASVQSFVQSGKLRALGAATATRLPAPLAVPTFEEQGFGKFRASTWLMLLYPAGTPKTLVKATHAAIEKSMHNPDVEQHMIAFGALPRFSASPEEADAFMVSEYNYWGDVVRRSGVQLD